MAKKINYYSRNFAEYRSDLVDFVRQYYPEILSDFSDASIGSVFIELNAAIGDNLAFHTDRMFQETQIDYAQERKSLLSMARTFGLKIPGKRPSTTIVDFSVTVPVLGDTFDVRYAPIIRRGAQVSGAGKVFETLDDIDFSSPFTTGGVPNRKIQPNTDANGNIINYTLIKREFVVNGQSKVFKKIITPSEVRPFFEVVLPEDNVISVDSVVALEGTNFTETPATSTFFDEENRWYQVDSLAQETVFVEDGMESSSTEGVVVGKYIKTNNKFMVEYTDNGFMKVRFGGGTQDIGSFTEVNIDPTLVNRIGDIINNMALGSTLPVNHTLFVRYRIGGGQSTNIGPNTITSIGTVNMLVDGPDRNRNATVKRTLSVNNPIPALGGREEPSIEEIRNMVRYNFSAQNRGVTLKDYYSLILKMPGRFGVPFRYSAQEVQNKVVINVLGLNGSGNLSNRTTSTIRENIKRYLSDFRMMNDYIVVKPGRILNLAFDVDIFMSKEFNRSQVVTDIVSTIEDYFDINKWQMGEDIFLADLVEQINNVSGVLNVIDFKIFNKVNGDYSPNEVNQPYVDEETREINIQENYMLFGDPVGMYEILRPNRDIKVRVKTN